jgi:beta-glucanase (GH16 family)
LYNLLCYSVCRRLLIDPEGNFEGTISVHHHGTGCGSACGAADSLDTAVNWLDWHTVSTEWTPLGVSYYLDGVLIKQVSHDIPDTNHRYTIQIAPNAAKFTSGQFQIDWVAVYSFDSRAYINSLGTANLVSADLPGANFVWKNVFSDDFSVAVAEGSFPGPNYSARWSPYAGFTDTSKLGIYDPVRVISVAGSLLHYRMHSEAGQPYVACLVACNNNNYLSQTYGRYEMRVRADVTTGYKIAFMLWPLSDNWPEGEVDCTAHYHRYQEI